MDALIIKGPAKLKGSVRVSGSKNTALPLLFSSLLFEKELTFSNVPRLWDIETTLKLLEWMGSSYDWKKEEGVVSIRPQAKEKEAPYEFVKKMRAGILALGPLVAKYGEAKVSLPGGCAIGARPVNFHLDALRLMGVEIAVEGGYILAKVKSRLQGAEIFFPEVTVTGTENILMVASLAEGTTIIRNAAQEPEVTALGEFLISVGAKIEGLGTSTVKVIGTKLNHPQNPIEIPADRIETGTWIAASAVTHSELTIQDCRPKELTAVLEVFRQIGVEIEEKQDGKTLIVRPKDRFEPITISTEPYPGFPTDMQAQMMVALCLAGGKSRIRETIFENRFMHVAELQRLGAKIEIDGHAATIFGPAKFTAAPLMATDLRASASLVLAALAANGETKISRIYHLDRGYQRLDEKLNALGAQIRRVQE